jgi:methyl coenzyme M reductase subunit D
MENIEFSHAQLSLAREIAVSHKNNILTDKIFLQIYGIKQISAQPVINGPTVPTYVPQRPQRNIPTFWNLTKPIRKRGKNAHF